MQIHINIFMSGVLYFGFAHGAAGSSSSSGGQSYTSNDYLVFGVMQQVAQTYFDVIDNANKDTRKQFKRDLHSMQDMRDSVPFEDGLYGIAQGLLFEPKKCRFYSRLGCWRFGKNYMVKMPKSHDPLKRDAKCYTEFSKINHWQQVRDVACAGLVLKQMKEQNDHEVFEVFSCNEDFLPPLCLTKKEDVALIPEPHVELEQVVAKPQSLMWSLSLGDLYQLLTNWISGEQQSDDDDEQYMMIGEPMQSLSDVPLVVMPTTCKKKQGVSSELLKIWYELKDRHAAEQKDAKEDFIDL